MRKGLVLLVIVAMVGMAGLMAYPLRSEQGVAITLMGASLMACLIWLSFYVGFGIKTNKVLAELAFIIAIPISFLIIRVTAWALKPLLHKKKERPKRKSWWTGSIFDVMKLRLAPLEVVIGTHWGKPIKIRLDKFHTLIGGSTDQGKTVLLNNIIAGLLLADTPVEVWIIDLKGAKEDALHLWAPVIAKYISDTESAIKALEGLVALMDKRNRDGYEREMVIIIDELVHLTKHMEVKYQRHSTRMLAVLARMCRAAGIRIVGATQYPYYEDVEKPIAHNLMRKICLGVTGPAQAGVILEMREKIPVPLPEKQGDFILREGKDFKIGRSIFVQPDDIREIVARAMDGECEDDIRLRILRRVTTGLQIGDRVKGLNAVAESLSLDSDLLKVIYRNFALAGALELGGESPQSGYRLAVEPLVAMGLVDKHIKQGRWDERLKSLWNNDKNPDWGIPKIKGGEQNATRLRGGNQRT